MAYPSYNSVQNISTGSNQTGRWKGFMHTDSTAKNISITTFNGEGVTFEGVSSNTIIPVAFNATYGAGTTVTDGKLFGLN